MKKIAASLLAVATTLFVFSSAQAQDVSSGVYGELGYTQFKGTTSTLGGTFKSSPVAFTGFLGYQFTPNMAVEGLVGLGAGEGRVKADGIKTDAKGQVKNALGVFFRPSIAVSDNLDLFARIGWARTEREVSAAAGVSVSDSDTDVAYGIGANFNLSKKSYIQANWMNYYKKDGLKIDGVTVAYGFRF